jgi:hypothetical protein
MVIKKPLFLLFCALALGAAGCGKADCADFARIYCDRATKDCGVGGCSVETMEAPAHGDLGPNGDQGPCVDAARNASCNDPAFICVAKCPTG